MTWETPIQDVLNQNPQDLTPSASWDGRFEGILASGFRLNASRRSLTNLLAKARDEELGYGHDSQFGRDLEYFVRSNGIDGLSALSAILGEERRNQEAVSESLRLLGGMDHLPTHLYRLAMLLKFLKSESARIRDSASLGIAAMDDPSAISVVELAVSIEQSDILKANLELVLDQLWQTQGCQAI